MTPEERADKFWDFLGPNPELFPDYEETKGELSSIIRAAVAEEREACAKIVEEAMDHLCEADIVGDLPDELPAAIRARGQA